MAVSRFQVLFSPSRIPQGYNAHRWALVDCRELRAYNEFAALELRGRYLLVHLQSVICVLFVSLQAGSAWKPKEVMP